MALMAEFAKKIGEGDFNSALDLSGETDTLAESLLIMRENLAQNSMRDSEQSWIAEGKRLFRIFYESIIKSTCWQVRL